MPTDHGRRPGGPPDRGRPQQESVRDRQENPRAEDVAAVLSGDATRIDEVAERLAMRLVPLQEPEHARRGRCARLRDQPQPVESRPGTTRW